LSPNAKRRPSVDTPTLKVPTRARILVRGACLVGAILLLLPVVPGASAPVVVPALSPFVAIAALLATRTFHAVALVGLAVGAVGLFRRRLFCRWVCPVGLCTDGAGRLGRRLGRRTVRGPKVGPWIVLLTFGGACLGYPLGLWLDPLAIFTGLFQLGPDGGVTFVLLAVIPFLSLLLLSLFWPNLWCTRICPLGAFQDLLFAWCRVPGSVLRRRGSENQTRETRRRLTRRTALGMAIGAVVAWATGLVRGKTSRPLRPPGAIDESKFVGVCTRCGNCLRSCPSGIIKHDLGQGGWPSLWTPVLSFRDDYCREGCTRCAEVCPSGALERFPREGKARVRIGLAQVDMDVCLLAEDRECSACARWCPYGAIRYVFSEAQYTLVVEVDPDKCTGCGACETACPTTPKKAIVVSPIATPPNAQLGSFGAQGQAKRRPILP